MHKILFHVVVLSLLAVLPVRADEIVFKTGKIRKGKVVEDRRKSDGKIVFHDTESGLLTLDMSLIQDIRLDDAAAAASAEPVLDEVDSNRNTGRFDQAFDLILNAVKANPRMTLQLSSPFQGMLYQVEARAKSLRNSDLEQAQRDYRLLFRVLTVPEAASLAGPEGAHERWRTAAGKSLSEINYELAVAKSKQPILMRDAQALLQEGVVADPSNINARLFLGDVARFNRDFPVATESYLAVTNTQGAPEEHVRRSYDGLRQIQAVTGQPALPQATPQSIATPAATPYTNLNPVAPAAAVTPAVADPEPTGPIWKQILTRLTNLQIPDNARMIVDEILTGQYNALVIGLPLAILIVWILPFFFLRYRAGKGDLAAAECRETSKRFGAFALVPYFVKSIKSGTPKNRCPFCNKGIDKIDSYTDLNFISCPHCHENITPIYELKDYIAHLVRQMEGASRHGHAKLDSTGDKDSMLKLVRAVLTQAVRRRASDLHVESELEGAKLRARVDGVMYDFMSLPKGISSAFISAIKIMANLDITERRIPQDGKASLWLEKQDVDLRINTSPAAMGEKVAIRILSQKSINVDPTKLGLEGENLERYERSIRKPHGLIAVTGPSGSGKSTTLYVALNEINTGEKNIVTIEDPIEYQLKGISQMQVNTAANFTFATGLRSILRQDPDVIMVGEIRDTETAEIAVEAAMTGHLVFTTLHTIDPATAFGRMADLGVETRRLSSAVLSIIGQRLVRTICNDCKRPYKPKKTDLELLNIATTAKDITFVHGGGCELCMNTGFYGRIGLFEFLVPDDTMREILETNAIVSVIRELARKNGFRSIREEGILKVMQGITTVEEVIRVTS